MLTIQPIVIKVMKYLPTTSPTQHEIIQQLKKENRKTPFLTHHHGIEVFRQKPILNHTPKNIDAGFPYTDLIYIISFHSSVSSVLPNTKCIWKNCSCYGTSFHATEMDNSLI